MTLYKNVNGTRIPLSKEEEAAVLAEREAVLKEKAATAWLRSRVRTYPRIGDQLDMLWHELNEKGNIGIDGEWFLTLKKIKDENPKPEQK